MDKCRSCQADIHWIKSKKTGKPIPCDPEILRIITEDGRVEIGFRVHFATCPQAKEWRKKE